LRSTKKVKIVSWYSISRAKQSFKDQCKKLFSSIDFNPPLWSPLRYKSMRFVWNRWFWQWLAAWQGDAWPLAFPPPYGKGIFNYRLLPH